MAGIAHLAHHPAQPSAMCQVMLHRRALPLVRVSRITLATPGRDPGAPLLQPLTMPHAQRPAAGIPQLPDHVRRAVPVLLVQLHSTFTLFPRIPRHDDSSRSRSPTFRHHPHRSHRFGERQKVYPSPIIDCHDGKIVAYTAGFHPNAELANRMLAEAAETLPDNARPVVHSDRGCHYRWPGWLELMERYGLIRSMSAKGCSPDNAAAEGFFGRMKTESVYPEHWEKRTRDEVLVLIDEYIHWYNHERIKQSLDWMSPVQYRQSQGMAA